MRIVRASVSNTSPATTRRTINPAVMLSPYS
jgi:hypothetical protein